MVKYLHIALDDDVHEDLSTIKNDRGQSWDDFMDDVIEVMGEE